MSWADIVTIAVGGVFMLATLIASVWRIVVWIQQIYTNKDNITKIDERLDNLSSDVGVLKSDVGVLKSDVGVLKSDVGVLKSDVGVLKSNVAEILAFIRKTTQENGAVKSTSPLSLTDYGKEISQSVNAPELAQKYLHKVDLAEATNAYEIQEACSNYARVRLLDELERGDKDIVQNYAFESGDNMAVVMSVIGIELRDTAFRNKGIVIAKKKKPRAKKARAKKKG